MGLDAILKRYFPVVICVLIAIAAYFQAAGMGQLVAGAFAVDPSALPAPPPPPRLSSVHSNQDHVTNGSAIISRNPFDSVTGPLEGSHELPSAPTGPVSNSKNPYNDHPCDVARVLLIAASDDPEWSFAAIAGADGKAVLRRQGHEVSGYTIAFIGRYPEWIADEAEKVEPPYDRVWMTQGGSRCQIQFGGKAPPARSPSATPAPAETSKKSSRKVPPEIAAKIHKISDNEFNVERSAVDSILENQADLMKLARLVPEKEGDKVVGIRLFGIRPDSLLGTLGLENGDRLQSINGFDMASPEKALEAYARLKSADHLTLTLNRRGKPQNIDFNIK